MRRSKDVSILEIFRAVAFRGSLAAITLIPGSTCLPHGSTPSQESTPASIPPVPTPNTKTIPLEQPDMTECSKQGKLKNMILAKTLQKYGNIGRFYTMSSEDHISSGAIMIALEPNSLTHDPIQTYKFEEPEITVEIILDGSDQPDINTSLTRVIKGNEHNVGIVGFMGRIQKKECNIAAYAWDSNRFLALWNNQPFQPHP